jgi:hypothetical protein
MKRRLLLVAAFVVALVPFAAVFSAPPANSYEVLSVCVTVTEKFIGIEINSEPIGIEIGPYPRTCIGV